MLPAPSSNPAASLPRLFAATGAVAATGVGLAMLWAGPRAAVAFALGSLLSMGSLGLGGWASGRSAGLVRVLPYVRLPLVLSLAWTLFERHPVTWVVLGSSTVVVGLVLGSAPAWRRLRFPRSWGA